MVNQFKLELLISGTAAGIAKTLASPIEVVKIRLQLQQALLEKQSIQNPYSGMTNCFKRLYL
jgi:solute carrier family 25 (adenine nucleotide translocator) protein 4/5/6/31